MKEIIKISLRILLLLILLFLITRTFKRADEKMFSLPVSSLYSRGNATDSTRKMIIEQLNRFQDGYSKRDIGRVDTFMQQLYSKENLLILGTMPNEIYRDYQKATLLVESDWASWGDCRFNIDSANISSYGDVAWISTRGYVKFDMSKYLVLPLRFTATMVREDQVWKFQQQQFQFDNDFSFSLAATLIISVWIIVSLVFILIKSVKLLRSRNSKQL